MCFLCGNQQNQCLFSVEALGTVSALPAASVGTTQAASDIYYVPYFIQALVASYRGVTPHVGSSPVITYGWQQDLSTGLYGGATNPRSLNSMEKEQARAAFAQWAAVADISFVEAPAGTVPDVQFAAAQMQAGGYAVLTKSGSSIWINATESPSLTYLHEIGHVLGLKHPGDYDAFSGNGERPFLPPYEDTLINTVMSYNGDDVSTLGIYDIAAIQYLFGPNKTFRAGDDPYFVNVADATRYIWDGGGNDTVSAEGSGRRVRIDLAEGAFSTFADDIDYFPQGRLLGGTGQFMIGYGTVIENAVGGYGNDVLIGNAADNRLTGGPGNDTLGGGAGQDTAVFAGKFAEYTIFPGYYDLTITRNNGETDQISGIEWLEFADMTIATPPLAIPGPPTPADPILTAKGGWVVEGDAGGVSQLVYSMKLTDATGWTTTSDKPVSFFVMTGSNGTAKAGTDYVALKQWVTIAPGQSGVTVAIDVLGDKIYEGNKTIELVISDLQGTSLAWQQKSTSLYGLVVDNDIPPQFSIAAYRALNPDVAAAYGNDATAMAWHYLNYGRAEGRAASGFNPEAYAALNPDLFAAFGLDENALINHYQQYGRAEGRATYGFDAISYSALNPDLHNAFWENRTALVQHYIDYGRAEGRATLGYDKEAAAAFNPAQQERPYGPPLEGLGNLIDGLSRDGGGTNGFDAETYAILNPDLLGAFGMNHEALIQHYRTIGRSEHRAIFLAPDGGNLSAIGVAGIVDDGLM
ncbi:hypothetical protein GE253_22705 [Niveispirillum sp. SYP-B3756]|uniref:M10 family metallopeptidase C-terminal domain-containing protein n=1 Tax=Niveispirillum sp. SYP-B3756 TaxID=2662178 RepID=UPI001290D1E1|nr:M10 family metallopeptidase C-terminal domain-containing protein [Niveispirillum sp. SYP-B3756]MQP68132.1 hypothetical protein [Niveispirillum sp. SYP-B3756]